MARLIEGAKIQCHSFYARGVLFSTGELDRFENSLIWGLLKTWKSLSFEIETLLLNTIESLKNHYPLTSKWSLKTLEVISNRSSKKLHILWRTLVFPHSSPTSNPWHQIFFTSHPHFHIKLSDISQEPSIDPCLIILIWRLTKKKSYYSCPILQSISYIDQRKFYWSLPYPVPY